MGLVDGLTASLWSSITSSASSLTHYTFPALLAPVALTWSCFQGILALPVAGRSSAALSLSTLAPAARTANGPGRTKRTAVSKSPRSNEIPSSSSSPSSPSEDDAGRRRSAAR